VDRITSDKVLRRMRKQKEVLNTVSYETSILGRYRLSCRERFSGEEAYEEEAFTG